VPVKPVPHSNIPVLERRIRQFSQTHRRVWYLADGLYSMSGQFAPVVELSQLVFRLVNAP
jgi:7-keto-8-aminopelargonate synthetase-like enzyme